MGPGLRTASASGHFGPIRQVDPGPMGVAPAEAQSGRMAGRGPQIHVVPGKPGGAPVVWRTREVGRKSGSHFFGSTNRPTKDQQTPARDAAISLKSRM